MRHFGNCRCPTLRDRNRGEPGKRSGRDIPKDAKGHHHSHDRKRVELSPSKGQRLHPVRIDPYQPGPACPESQKGKTDDKKFILPERSVKIPVEEGTGRAGVSTTGTVQSGESIKTTARQKADERCRVSASKGKRQTGQHQQRRNGGHPLSRKMTHILLRIASCSWCITDRSGSSRSVCPLRWSNP